MKLNHLMALAITAGSLTLLTACANKENKADSDTAVQTEQEVKTIVETDSIQVELDSIAAKYNDEFFTKEGGEYKTTASGLKYVTLTEGTGKTPTADDTVTVNYEGRLLNGTIFDSSYARNEPTSFPLNQVIKGWTEGLQLMKEGGKTIFYIPSEIAYGANGTPGGPIPPNANLIFTVELISINQ